MYFNKFELHYLHSVTWLSHGCIALVIIGPYFEHVCPRKLKFGQDEGTKRKIFSKGQLGHYFIGHGEHWIGALDLTERSTNTAADTRCCTSKAASTYTHNISYSYGNNREERIHHVTEMVNTATAKNII